MPHVVVVCLILAVASQAQGFIDPTLEPHMRQVSKKTSENHCLNYCFQFKI